MTTGDEDLRGASESGLEDASGLEDVSGLEEFKAGQSDRIGECQEAVPFGEVFYVFANGQKYLTCSHTPPHTHPG